MAKKKKSIEKPKLRELGQKSRASRVLSEYLRGIASERTECIRNPETGKKEIVSKGEAMARRIWEKALGREWDDEQKQYVETDISLSWVKLLLERIEGKAGSGDGPEDNRPKVADRVSEMNRDRLNVLAEGDDEG